MPRLSSSIANVEQTLSEAVSLCRRGGVPPEAQVQYGGNPVLESHSSWAEDTVIIGVPTKMTDYCPEWMPEYPWLFPCSVDHYVDSTDTGIHLAVAKSLNSELKWLDDEDVQTALQATSLATKPTSARFYIPSELSGTVDKGEFPWMAFDESSQKFYWQAHSNLWSPSGGGGQAQWQATSTAADPLNPTGLKGIRTLWDHNSAPHSGYGDPIFVNGRWYVNGLAMAGGGPTSAWYQYYSDDLETWFTDPNFLYPNWGTAWGKNDYNYSAVSNNIVWAGKIWGLRSLNDKTATNYTSSLFWAPISDDMRRVTGPPFYCYERQGAGQFGEYGIKNAKMYVDCDGIIHIWAMVYTDSDQTSNKIYKMTAKATRNVGPPKRAWDVPAALQYAPKFDAQGYLPQPHVRRYMVRQKKFDSTSADSELTFTATVGSPTVTYTDYSSNYGGAQQINCSAGDSYKVDSTVELPIRKGVWFSLMGWETTVTPTGKFDLGLWETANGGTFFGVRENIADQLLEIVVDGVVVDSFSHKYMGGPHTDIPQHSMTVGIMQTREPDQTKHWTMFYMRGDQVIHMEDVTTEINAMTAPSVHGYFAGDGSASTRYGVRFQGYEIFYDA